MTRLRSLLRWMFSWQVAGPVVAYALSALLIATVVEAFVARNDATDTQRSTVAAASRRIDLLNADITRLQNRLQQDARERGRLEETIRILVEQVRRLGARPVTGQTAGAAPSPSPAASSTPSPRPSSHPSHTPVPSPRPSPSPTCDLLHPLRCL